MSRCGVLVSCCASLLAVFASHAIFQASRVPGFVFIMLASWLPEFQTANALEVVKGDGAPALAFAISCCASFSISFSEVVSVGISVSFHLRFALCVAFSLAVSAAIVSAVHASLRSGSTVVSIPGLTRSCPRCLASALTVHPVFISASSIRMLCRIHSGSLPIHQPRQQKESVHDKTVSKVAPGWHSNASMRGFI